MTKLRFARLWRKCRPELRRAMSMRLLRQTTRFVENRTQCPNHEQNSPILAWHDAIQHGPEGRQLLPGAPKND